jgi:hypothetical protein
MPYEAPGADPESESAELNPVSDLEQADSDVPSDYFVGCGNYLAVLDKIDQLEQQGKALQGSGRKLYSPSDLTAGVWRVIRTLRDSKHPSALHEDVVKEWLANEGITNAGGLRNALAEVVGADYRARSEEQLAEARAREAIEDSE